tara:strand:- start:2182 stop:2310 length:129 start_codon:yes stop_codon:yes gene_type:complete
MSSQSHQAMVAPGLALPQGVERQRRAAFLGYPGDELARIFHP